MLPAGAGSVHFLDILQPLGHSQIQFRVEHQESRRGLVVEAKP